MRMKILVHTDNMRFKMRTFKECNMLNPKKITLRREKSKERQNRSQRNKRRKQNKN